VKRHLLGFAAFLICFVFAGLASFLLRANQPISLCEISAHPERYQGKTVRVRALISRDVSVGSPVENRQVSAFAACAGIEEWSTAAIDLDDHQASALKPNVHVWRDSSDSSNYFLTDAIVIGLFDPHDDGITRCFTPRFELANAKVERVISTTLVDRTEAVAWVKFNSQ
jgi:hypothetical protein